MCGSCLRDFIVRFRFDGMYQIREFHSILNKEYRHIVAYQIEISFLCVEFDGKATNITGQICGSPGTSDRRKTYKYRGLYFCIVQKTSFGQLSQRFVQLKNAMCARSPGMHHAFGDTFVVKMGNLLP